MSGVGPFLSENYESDRNILKHAINQYTMVIQAKTGGDENEIRQNLVKYFKANKEKFKSRRAKVIIKNKQEDRELKIIPFSSVLKYVQQRITISPHPWLRTPTRMKKNV